MRIVAIIQARMNSTRLPGKVMKEMVGKPMIELLIERVRQAKEVTAVWLATTTKRADDVLAAWARKKRVPCFRGSEDDVLDRYKETARRARAEVIVRITGDCPLIDPIVIDTVVTEFRKRKVDYAAVNRRINTYPDGLDVEVCSSAALFRAWQEAKLPSEREHVTPYIWKHPRKFRLFILKNAVDYSAHRWTIDDRLDFEFVKAVYEHLYRPQKMFRMGDILRFVKEHPEYDKRDARAERDEGYQQSLSYEKNKNKDGL